MTETPMPEAVEVSKAPWKKNWKSHLAKALRTGSTLALVLAQLRRSKGLSGWVAVGISAASFALDVATQWKEIMAPSAWDFFNDSEKWDRAPSLLKTVITKNCEGTQILARENDLEIRRGFLGRFEVYWRECGGSVDYGPFFLQGERDAGLRVLGDKLWDQAGSKNVVLSKHGTLEDSEEALEGDPVLHESMTALHERVMKFMEEKENRSYLLEGPPGSGKSTAIKYILHKLNLKSLRLNFDDATDGSRWDGNKTAFNTSSLIKMMRPDILIIDDFERNFMADRDLLHLMEVAHQHCRVVLATVNNKEILTGAMKRVGRFDDHVVIDKIPLEVVKSMLDPELHEFARKVSSWPIAYIGDLNTRKRVLGVEAAKHEFPAMHFRATGKKLRSSKPVKVGKRVSKKKSSKKKRKSSKKVPQEVETSS